MGAYSIQLETPEQLALSKHIGGGLEKTGEYKGSRNIWSVVSYIRALQKSAKQ